MHSLRAFLTERLTAAAEEILEAVGKTILEYNEEISRSKDLEISRLRSQLRLLKSELRSGTSLGGQPQTHDHHDHHHHHPSPHELPAHPHSFPAVVGNPESELREGDACSIAEQEPPEPAGSEVKEEEPPEPSEVKEEEEEEPRRGPFWIDHDDAEQLEEGLDSDVRDFMSSPAAAFHSHAEEHRDKPYSCSVCDKRFSHCSHLAAHFRTHTGERPYRCEICRKGFVTTSGLNRHQTIHTEGKRFVCNFCGRSFKWMDSLGRHVRSVHKGDSTSD